VHHLLENLGTTTGLLSTIEVRTGGGTAESALTTPGPIELQRTLRRMVEHDCTACAMEVSSHALDQERVHGLDFAVGIFTNITTDHLDYHGTPRAYRQAKKKLFDDLNADATALYNADDEAGTQMVADTAATPVSYALDRNADIRPDILESRIEGLRLTLNGQERTFRLAGRFNAYNLAAAYGAGRALGHEANSVLDALADAPPVPGRFEQLTFEHGPTVVVDYAHTPDGLAGLLESAAALAGPRAGGAVTVVFGCGGDRDVDKRPQMGAVAEAGADRVIVTSDNPRHEDPATIIGQIVAGAADPGGLTAIVDRREAIAHAVSIAAPGDVVVIAGKGHETTQDLGDRVVDFDDRAVARALLEERS